MQTILVTGGAGYLGSVMIGTLLNSGYKVIVLDTFVHGHNSLAQNCYNPRLEIVKADCRDRNVLAQYLPMADVIIPLAAVVGARSVDLDRTGAESLNYRAICDIIEMKKNHQCLLYANTNSGYGHMKGQEIIDESSPLIPHSYYAKTKVWAEKEVLSCENSLSFRIATVFGASPKMRRDLLVNDFVYRAVTDKSLTLFDANFRRNFIHIRDVCNAFCYGIENFSAMKNSIFNLGLSESNLTKRELCQKIKAIIPNFQVFEAPIGSDIDRRDYLVSNEKIESRGWRPDYSLDDGIKELIKLYQSISDSKYCNV